MTGNGGWPTWTTAPGAPSMCDQGEELAAAVRQSGAGRDLGMGMMIPQPLYLAAAIAQLERGQREVLCLIPENCWELQRRRVVFVRIWRRLRAAGMAAHIVWVWYREDAEGEPETVFKLIRKEDISEAKDCPICDP